MYQVVKLDLRTGAVEVVGAYLDRWQAGAILDACRVTRDHLIRAARERGQLSWWPGWVHAIRTIH